MRRRLVNLASEIALDATTVSYKAIPTDFGIDHALRREIETPPRPDKIQFQKPRIQGVLALPDYSGLSMLNNVD